IADRDQPLPQVVTPFLRWKRVVQERIRVARHVTDLVHRPSFGISLISVIAIVEGKLGGRHGWRADAQLNLFIVSPAAAALAAIRPKAIRMDAQGAAGGTGLAAWSEERRAETPPASLK